VTIFRVFFFLYESFRVVSLLVPVKSSATWIRAERAVHKIHTSICFSSEPIILFSNKNPNDRLDLSDHLTSYSKYWIKTFPLKIKKSTNLDPTHFTLYYHFIKRDSCFNLFLCTKGLYLPVSTLQKCENTKFCCREISESTNAFY